MTETVLMSVKYLVFPNGKLTDEDIFEYEDRDAGLVAYDVWAQSPLTLTARLFIQETGQIIRNYRKPGYGIGV